MAVDFKTSKTKDNLMKAFAGESQARNRYTFAAEKAKKAGYEVLEKIFLFTAEQERAHAEIFYNHLKELNGENLEITGSFPVEVYEDVDKLLRPAQHNDYEEHDNVYEEFEQIAKEEGFEQVAGSFHMIKDIEKTHGDRFGHFADMLEQNKLFCSEERTHWMCLNCGYIYEGMERPQQCPTCQVDKGYFVPLSLSPYSREEPVKVMLKEEGCCCGKKQ